jgi:pimeloyl-ACP methyl ester carboxylesterase
MTEFAANRLTLADGRGLAWAEYGDAAGRPLFFFHGTPGSRVTASVFDAAARARGVRVIAPERPGCGESDSKPGRALLDWPNDVAQLADSLRIEGFAVAGISGGGPYVAACAHALSPRVTSAAILSGIGPTDAPGATRGMLVPNRLSLWSARHAPLLCRALMAVLARQFRNPERAIAGMLRSLPRADRQVLADPQTQALFIADFRAALARTSEGALSDFRIFARPWGLRLDEIGVPVHIWHGERDRNCPVAMARALAAVIPGSSATIAPDEGHLFALTRLEPILDALVGRA